MLGQFFREESEEDVASSDFLFFFKRDFLLLF